MRSAIAIIMAVLGTILVLSGAAALWATALVRPRPVDAPLPTGATPTGATSTGATSSTSATVASRAEKAADVVSRVPGPERLIVWGVALLALSAVAAGAITLSATATAGN